MRENGGREREIRKGPLEIRARRRREIPAAVRRQMYEKLRRERPEDFFARKRASLIIQQLIHQREEKREERERGRESMTRWSFVYTYLSCTFADWLACAPSLCLDFVCVIGNLGNFKVQLGRSLNFDTSFVEYRGEFKERCLIRKFFFIL